MIITLIGSARFEPWFKVYNKVLSLAGHTVYGLSSYPSENNGLKEWYTEQDKRTLDWVHKEKIRQSQAVVLLNIFAYTGESTEGEVDLALELGLPVYPVESWGKGIGVGHMHTNEHQAWATHYNVLGVGSKREYCRAPFKTSFALYDLLNGVGAAEVGDLSLRRRLVQLLRDFEAGQRAVDMRGGVARPL